MSGKKRPIQAHEKFYIEQNPDNLSIADLAKMFGRTEQVVRNIVVKFKTKQGTKKHYNTKQDEEVAVVAEQPVTTPVVPQGQKISPLMGKVERNGTVVATVMTPAASEASDDARKSNVKTLSAALKNSIHKCKGG